MFNLKIENRFLNLKLGVRMHFLNKNAVKDTAFKSKKKWVINLIIKSYSYIERSNKLHLRWCEQ